MVQAKAASQNDPSAPQVAAPKPKSAVEVLSPMRRLSIHGVKPNAAPSDGLQPKLPAYGEPDGRGLSQAGLADLWTAYLERLMPNHTGYYASLKDAQYAVMEDGCTILLTFRNRIEMKTFENLQSHILGYLRYKLKREDINIRAQMSTEGAKGAMAVLTKEIYFEALLSENPALRELMETFKGYLV